MLTFVNRYGNNIYSQNLEDGIIAECLERMKIDKGICVEFGAADGKFCSNTYYLLQQGWKGLMIEYDKNLYTELKENIRGMNCMPLNEAVLPSNINILLPGNIDVLSIDTDGANDFECFSEYKGNAKIVIIEINSSKEPMVLYLDEGASYRTMAMLAIQKGYFILCHTGNLICIKNEYRNLFPELDGIDPFTDWELYFNKKWL